MGFVYFLFAGNRVKVGFSFNPGGRLMSVLMVQLWDELFIRARPVADLCG